MQPRAQVLVRVGGQFGTVHQQVEPGREIPGFRTLHHLLDRDDPVDPETGIPLFLEGQHQFHLVGAVFPVKVGQQIDRRRRPVQQEGHHIVDAVALDLNAADRGKGPADPGEDHPQVIIDFRRGGHGRARIARIDLLLDGDGRRNTLDRLDIGFGHPTEELPRIRGKALGETALSLREEGVESEGRLAGSGNTRNNDELSPGDFHRQVLQVVDLRSFYDDVSFCRHR